MRGKFVLQWWPALIALAVAASCENSQQQLITNTSSSTESQLTEPQLDSVREYFSAQVAEGHEPGIQVLIAQRGEILLHENFGVKNNATGEALTNDALFRIASFTKPVTNAAAMILWDEGHFKLDDPIDKFLPELKDLSVYVSGDAESELVLEPATRSATMRELMTHTAGFTYGGALGGKHPVNAIYANVQPAADDIDADESMRRLGTIPLAYQPGTEYMYSFSADILGIIIERISGKDLPTFMRERIFEPLAMQNTMPWVPEEDLDRLMPIHTRTEDGQLVPLPIENNGIWERDPATYEPLIFGGGGGLVSTPTDFYRFAEMLRRGGELDGVRVLSKDATQLMTSQQYPEGVRERYWAPGQGHGLNLSVVTDPDRIPYPTSAGEFSHGGLFNGYFLVDPELELVVIMQGQLLPPRYRPHHIPAVTQLLHETTAE
ncbi:MAG: serine hydrolase domain-containing protein [Pseudomonadota bacterium]